MEGIEFECTRLEHNESKRCENSTQKVAQKSIITGKYKITNSGSFDSPRTKQSISTYIGHQQL